MTKFKCRNKLVLDSYAKLNLYLEVLHKRADGYHNLKTLFERIGLKDKIILKRRGDKRIIFTSHSPGLPPDQANLCFKTAKLLQESLKVKAGVQIQLIKNIPIGSGLGGGSSNAACVLKGLNQLWQLKLNQKELCRYAQTIGSDVPFFIYDSPFAIGEARGDKIKPLLALRRVKFWHVLAVPRVRVSTPVIFQQWDALKEGKNNKYGKGLGLTSNRDSVNILTLALRKKDLKKIGSCLFNSLERVTLKLCPQIKSIRKKLADLGVKSILMSGSGPAVFGMVSSRKEAHQIYHQLRRNQFWRVFVTRTH